MSIFNQLPYEVWSKIADLLLDVRDWASLGMSNKYMASTLQVEVQEISKKIKEFTKCSLVGTKLFYYPGETLRTKIKRYSQLLLENEEMERRLPSTIHVESRNISPEKMTEISEFLRVYNYWKEIDFMDEIDDEYIEIAFKKLSEQKEEIRKETVNTWGYNISECMFNFIAAYTSLEGGIAAWIKAADMGFPLSMLEWILNDREFELNFITLNGKPVDIRLHDRYWAEPEIVTATDGHSVDLDRFSLYYDRPDMPTCVVRQSGRLGFGVVTHCRTLLEHYGYIFLHEVIRNWFGENNYDTDEEYFDPDLEVFDEQVYESDDSDTEQSAKRQKIDDDSPAAKDHELIKKYKNKFRSLHTFEQLLKFEKVFGIDKVGPELFTERRTRKFKVNHKNRFVVIPFLQFDRAPMGATCTDMGIYVGENAEEQIEEAFQIVDKHTDRYTTEKEFIDNLFIACKEANNFIPILEWYQDNKHEHDLVPDLATYVQTAYSQMGIPLYAEICRLLEWQQKTPAIRGRLAMYKEPKRRKKGVK